MSKLHLIRLLNGCRSSDPKYKDLQGLCQSRNRPQPLDLIPNLWDYKRVKEHTSMTNTATRSIDDLTTREREFFFRALRENDNAATDWEWEGFCNLCGRFGFWGVKNPRHSFDG